MNKLSVVIKKTSSHNVCVTPKIETFEKKVESVTLILSVLLSSEISLYVKTRRFDWNISKVNTVEMHSLFEFQYLQLEISIKAITDRINKFGTNSVKAMKEYLALSQINEAPKKYPPSKEMINQLLDDHESAIVHLRNDIGIVFEKYNDVDTADFLISRMESHETMARLLRRASLKQQQIQDYLYN